MSWSRVELSCYVDGELPPERASAVEAHLRSCAECRGVVDGFRRTGALVRRAQVAAPPGAWRQPLRSALPATGSPARRLAMAVSLAVALLLLVLAVSLVADRASTLRAPADARGWPWPGRYTIDVAVEGGQAVARVGPGGRVTRQPVAGSPWALAATPRGTIAGVVSAGPATLVGSSTSLKLPLDTVSAIAVRGDVVVAAGAAGVGGGLAAVRWPAGDLLWSSTSFASAPPALAFLPDGKLAVADTRGALSLIDAASGATLGSLPLPGGVDPLTTCLALPPPASRQARDALYLVNGTRLTVEAVRVDPLGVDAHWQLALPSPPVALLRTPAAVAAMYSQTACGFSPDGRELYVIGSGERAALAAVDVASGKVVRSLPAPDGGFGGLAVSPDGRWLYVSAGGQGDLLVVDAATLAVRGRVVVGAMPRAVVLGPP